MCFPHDANWRVLAPCFRMCTSLKGLCESAVTTACDDVLAQVVLPLAGSSLVLTRSGGPGCPAAPHSSRSGPSACCRSRRGRQCSSSTSSHCSQSGGRRLVLCTRRWSTASSGCSHGTNGDLPRSLPSTRMHLSRELVVGHNCLCSAVVFGLIDLAALFSLRDQAGGCESRLWSSRRRQAAV